jgi:hypothetical protein
LDIVHRVSPYVWMTRQTGVPVPSGALQKKKSVDDGRLASTRHRCATPRGFSSCGVVYIRTAELPVTGPPATLRNFVPTRPGAVAKGGTKMSGG